jgi:hypothetical protein
MFAFAPRLKGHRPSHKSAEAIAAFRMDAASTLAALNDRAMELLRAGYDSYGNPVDSSEDEAFLQRFLGYLDDLRAQL